MKFKGAAFFFLNLSPSAEDLIYCLNVIESSNPKTSSTDIHVFKPLLTKFILHSPNRKLLFLNFKVNLICFLY